MKVIGVIIIILGGLLTVFSFFMFANDGLLQSLYQDFGIAILSVGVISILTGIGFIKINKRI